MEELDMPPVDEFLEMITAGGGEIYACKLAVDMFKLEKEDLPIYFLTAISESEVESHIINTGADGYILKPFNFTDFDKILDILSKN